MLLRWKDGARTEAAQLLATQSAKLASVDRSDDLSKSAGHPKLRNSRLLGLHQIPAQSLKELGSARIVTSFGLRY
jgi:hypothetical protein